MVRSIVRLTAGLALAQAIPGGAAAAAAAAGDSPFPESHSLVVAACDRMKDEGACVFEVEKVLLGDRVIIGDEFLVDQRGRTLSGPLVGPAPIAIGDSGLFLLEKRERIVPLPDFARPDGPSFPSWRGISPRYGQALEWAHAVERVLDEPDRARADALLAELVFSRVEEIASWSTHRLFEGGRRDALAFCEENVSSARWPMTSRLAVDAESLLVELRDPHSISLGSNARKAILAAFAWNEGLSDGVRASAIQAALRSARSGLGTPWLFEFCTRIASTSKSERVVSNALGTLAAVERSDGQLDTLLRLKARAGR